MTRRVFLLMGMAILAVVGSHAAGFGEIAMINWADRYRSVTVPNYDMVGTLPYDLLVVIRQLIVWAVPAFLFCSGFFVAYAARGTQGVYKWRMARTRVIDLLIPYTIWSVAWFILAALQGIIFTPNEYVTRFLTGQADGGSYFFVPLLCQFYLLSPLLVPLARTRPKQLTIAATLIQLGGFIIMYLKILDSEHLNVLSVTIPSYISWVNNNWVFLMWTTYFTLGLVSGFHSERIKQAVLQHKRILIGALLLFGFVSLFEAEAVYWSTRYEVRYMPFTLSTWWYSIAFVLAFIVFDKIRLPLPARLNQIGSKSYGVYLVHLVGMGYAARILRQISPWLLAYPVLLFMPLMFIIGLGIPLLLMTAFTKLPIRRYYRYVFG